MFNFGWNFQTPLECSKEHELHLYWTAMGDRYKVTMCIIWQGFVEAEEWKYVNGKK